MSGTPRGDVHPKALDLTLRTLPGRFAVCRLEPNAAVPAWATGAFVSITRTDEELSIVCAEEQVPPGVEAERGFKLLRVDGPLDFSLVGILARIASALATAGISIFAVSSFTTDHLLVREGQLAPSREALSRAAIRLR